MATQQKEHQELYFIQWWSKKCTLSKSILVISFILYQVTINTFTVFVCFDDLSYVTLLPYAMTTENECTNKEYTEYNVTITWDYWLQQRMTHKDLDELDEVWRKWITKIGKEASQCIKDANGDLFMFTVVNSIVCAVFQANICILLLNPNKYQKLQLILCVICTMSSIIYADGEEMAKTCMMEKLRVVHENANYSIFVKLANLDMTVMSLFSTYGLLMCFVEVGMSVALSVISWKNNHE